jgi:hypothetical protein
MRFFIDFDDDDTTPTVAGGAGLSGSTLPPPGSSTITAAQETFWKTLIEQYLDDKLNTMDTELPTIIGSTTSTTSRGSTTTLDFVLLIIDEIEKRIASSTTTHTDDQIADKIIEEFKITHITELATSMTALKVNRVSAPIFDNSGKGLDPVLIALDSSKADLVAMVNKYISDAVTKFSADRLKATSAGKTIDAAYLKNEYTHYSDNITGIKKAVSKVLKDKLLEKSVYEAFHKLVPSGTAYDGGRRRKFRRSDGRKKRSHGKKKRSDGRRGKGRRKSPK